jgi:lysophospholipase L1-like esterase
VIGRVQRPALAVIVCTPSVIGEKKAGANSLDAKLDEYSEVSRKVAKETGSHLCDLRKAFADHLAKHNEADKDKGILTGDRVHLNDAGNALVAAEILKLLEAK